MSGRKLVSELLWGNRGRTNFLFAGTGLLMGFVMLLLAVHLYKNIYQPVSKDLKEEQSSSFLIINKKVGLGNTIGFAKSTFSEEDVDDFRKEPFIEDVAPFSSNQFRAHLFLAEYGESELPLEAIVNKFLDTIPDHWEWNEGDPIVPVIMSNEFLNLYNFVVAPTWGSRQIPRDVINKINGRLQIIGNNKIGDMKIKVVGFSDRIVSVLVPQNFMDWANAQYGDGEKHGANRIMIQVKDPSDKRLSSYLDKNGYETNKDKLKSSAQSIVSVLILVITILGSIILLLAVLLFLTTFRLFIARQKTDIDLLFQLGYTVRSISRVWMRLFIWLVTVLTIISCIIIFFVNLLVVDFTEKQGLQIVHNVNPVVYATAVIFAFLIVLYNQVSIRRLLVKMYQ